MPQDPLTVGDMVDALLLFDEPILNSRYHGMLERHPAGAAREGLLRVPGMVLQAERAARAGAEKWMRAGRSVLDPAFFEWGERTLLDSFLAMMESQQRLTTFMARAAPTRDIRSDFDRMAQIQREVARTLREALADGARGSAAWADAERGGTRSVQEEDASGDLRGQIEAALRASADAGHETRVVMLSPTALRHLRDQGCFQDGETRLRGAPVMVDFSWDAPAFALLSFDAVPLEEIIDDAAGDAPA